MEESMGKCVFLVVSLTNIQNLPDLYQMQQTRNQLNKTTSHKSYDTDKLKIK